MTDLLCNWLNTEVKLSAKIGKCDYFAEFFAVRLLSGVGLPFFSSVSSLLRRAIWVVIRANLQNYKHM